MDRRRLSQAKTFTKFRKDINTYILQREQAKC